MEDLVYYTSLFDIYYSLLTAKQQSYFKDYYFDNLLLDEISKNNNISKNAVSKEIKRVKELLDNYEEKLGLYAKRKKLYETFKNDEDVLKKIEDIIL